MTKSAWYCTQSKTKRNDRLRYITRCFTRTNICNMFSHIRITSWYCLPTKFCIRDVICDTIYDMICLCSHACNIRMKSYYPKTALGNRWKRTIQKNTMNYINYCLSIDNNMMDERFWNANVRSMILGCYTDRKYLAWKNWRKIIFVHPKNTFFIFYYTTWKY